MSLFIKYTVTSSVALVLVTLLAFVGGYLRRDLVCPNHVSLFPFCYWSVAIGFTVPCAAAVSAAVLGLVTRFVSFGFDLVRSFLVPIATKVRSLVRGYPWYCLLVALVLFGPWDWRLGWVISSLLARLGSLLELVVASARYLFSLLAPPVLTAWSRIQIKATACERIRAKAIGSHMALGLKILVWIPSLTSRTGFEWLYELWRTTNPRKLRSSSVVIGQCATPAIIDYAELQAKLIQEATVIATRKCNEIPSARLQQLGGWSVAHPWTVNFELQRLERQHPAGKGLDLWKQAREQESKAWDADRVRRRALQTIPGAYNASNYACSPSSETQQDCGIDTWDTSNRCLASDALSMILLPWMVLLAFLSVLSPSTGHTASSPTPEKGPSATVSKTLASEITPDAAPQHSHNKLRRPRTRFITSSNSQVISDTSTRPLHSVHAPAPLPEVVRATPPSKILPRGSTTDLTTEGRPQSPTGRSPVPSGAKDKCVVFDLPTAQPPSDLEPDITDPLPQLSVGEESRPIGHVESQATTSCELELPADHPAASNFAPLEPNLDDPNSITIDWMLQHCGLEPAPAQPAAPTHEAHIDTPAASMDPATMIVPTDEQTLAIFEDIAQTPEGWRMLAELNAFIDEQDAATNMGAPAVIESFDPQLFHFAVLPPTNPPGLPFMYSEDLSRQMFQMSAMQANIDIHADPGVPNPPMSVSELAFFQGPLPAPWPLDISEFPVVLMDPCLTSEFYPSTYYGFDLPVHLAQGVYEHMMIPMAQPSIPSGMGHVDYSAPSAPVLPMVPWFAQMDANGITADISMAFLDAAYTPDATMFSPEPSDVTLAPPSTPPQPSSSILDVHMLSPVVMVRQASVQNRCVEVEQPNQDEETRVYAPCKWEDCLQALFTKGWEMSSWTLEIPSIPESWSSSPLNLSWTPYCSSGGPCMPSANDNEEVDELESSVGEREERWTAVAQLHQKLSASTSRIRRKAAGVVEKSVRKLEKHLRWDEFAEQEPEERSSRPRGNRRIERPEGRSRRGVAC